MTVAKVGPGHPNYSHIVKQFAKEGRPRQLEVGGTLWLRIEEDGQMVFVGSPPKTMDQAYGSSSFVTGGTVPIQDLEIHGGEDLSPIDDD